MGALLLDSNAFLRLLNNKELLGPKTLALLQAPDATVAVSVVSIWELGLKYSKTKSHELYSIAEMLDGVSKLGVELLGLKAAHLEQYEHIQLTHKDPFDRLLVAQNEAEGSTLLTSDHHILESSYRVFDTRT